jgi:hypothetical protein
MPYEAESKKLAILYAIAKLLRLRTKTEQWSFLNQEGPFSPVRST